MRVPASSSVLLLTLLVLGFAHPARAGEGGNSSGGGGGDPYAAHFADVGARLDRAYLRICDLGGHEVSELCQAYPDFSRAVQLARILPTDTLPGTDGKEREAGPDGSGNIQLNVQRYQRHLKAADAAIVVYLVAHEYMIAARAEGKDSYVQSSRLMVALQSQQIDLLEIAYRPRSVYQLDQGSNVDLEITGGLSKLHVETDGSTPSAQSSLQISSGVAIDYDYRRDSDPTVSSDRESQGRFNSLQLQAGLTTQRDVDSRIVPFGDKLSGINVGVTGTVLGRYQRLFAIEEVEKTSQGLELGVALDRNTNLGNDLRGRAQVGWGIHQSVLNNKSGVNVRSADIKIGIEGGALKRSGDGKTVPVAALDVSGSKSHCSASTHPVCLSYGLGVKMGSQVSAHAEAAIDYRRRLNGASPRAKTKKYLKVGPQFTTESAYDLDSQRMNTAKSVFLNVGVVTQ